MLEQVENRSFYLKIGRYAIGAYLTENNKVILIDSGLEDGHAKKIVSVLKAYNKDITISAIINTHFHADHCGGNAHLSKLYKNIKIFSTKVEKAYIENPDLEPQCFCSGAAPFKELQNKFLNAKPSVVTNVIEPYEDTSIEIDNASFKIVTLPGHTSGMIGVITPDNVFYTGDAIFGPETFGTHKVLFYTNFTNALKSLEKIRTLEVAKTVFYHGGLLENTLENTVDVHINKINGFIEFLYGQLSSGPKSIDELVQRTMLDLEIPENPVQFTLTRTCVNAGITYLQEQKKVQIKMHKGMLVATRPDAPQNTSVQTRTLQTSTLLKDVLEEIRVSESHALHITFKPTHKLSKDNDTLDPLHPDSLLLTSVQEVVKLLRSTSLIANTEISVTGLYQRKFQHGSSNSDLFKSVNQTIPPTVTEIILKESEMEIRFKEIVSHEQLNTMASTLNTSFQLSSCETIACSM